MAARYCEECRTRHRLAERFWPGPLTMILPRKKLVPLRTTGGLENRCPLPGPSGDARCHPEADVPIAAPSGNTSGETQSTCASDMREDMDGKIDAIF